MQVKELAAYLDELLDAAAFKDYCPNGLQVEGRAQVTRVLCGVTASQALLDAAVGGAYDAVFVHHGYFWKGEDGRISGIRRRRLQTLLGNELNLLAYHLPLDAHPQLGNNAQLGALLGWTGEGRFGDSGLGWIGRPQQPGQSAAALGAALGRVLERSPLLVGNEGRIVERVAWCSGGAQDWFEAAIEAGADVFVSGEISEQTVHLARESGVPYIAAGHHATERYGARAIAGHLRSALGLEADFLDLDNPV